MNFLDIEINNVYYIQRSEFSKIITVDKKTNKKKTYDTIEDLPLEFQTYMKEYNEIINNPHNFFEFTIDENSICITKFYNKEKFKNLIIPSKIDGLPVTDLDLSITDDDIENLFIPYTVKSLNYSKIDCSSLKNVKISNNINTIPCNMFRYCGNLENINLEMIKVIGDNAFYGCEKLNNPRLDNLDEIKKGAFIACNKITKIDAPKLKCIGGYAFMECKKLKEINFNEELEHIGQEAFYGCLSLEKIILPDTLEIIFQETFGECRSLKSINIPKNLKFINKGAFNNSGLEGTLNLPSTLQKISEFAFAYCKFSEINASKNTYIDDWAFSLEQKTKIKIYDLKEPKQKFKINIFNKER